MGIRVRNAPKRFSEKILVLEKSGLTVPKRPKMAQNGPKMVVNRKFLENGSNDFPDFWPEVPKNPVFLDSGLTVPKRPKNLFFEIWSIYIVIMHENEALGLEKNKKIFLEFFAIFGPPFQPKKPYLDRKWSKINIRLILSYDPSFFMFRARKKSKKIFRSQKGPKRAKKGQKGSLWVKIFKKMKVFQIFFLFDLNDSESKK